MRGSVWRSRSLAATQRTAPLPTPLRPATLPAILWPRLSRIYIPFAYELWRNSFFLFPRIREPNKG